MRLKQFIITILLVVLLAFTDCAAVFAEEDGDSTTSELYALSAVLMDADNGRILLQKNGLEILPMASTTKIMTCILALEEAQREDFVSVSSYAAGMPKVHLGISKGEVFKLNDLLYSLMLESHNDSAAVIAEHVGNCLLESGRRSMDNSPEESKEAILKFAERMNRKAEEIGCENTFFVTPNGLDAILTYTDEAGQSVEKQHSTTASDLARIMSYCVTQSPAREAFLEITRQAGYSFTDYVLNSENQYVPGSRSYSCNNHNAFLNMMEGALTGKTGFTGKAGYCYVGALSKEGKTFSIALLACGWPNHKSWKWHDAKLLYQYGLDHYEKKNIYQQAELKPVPVLNGRQAETVLAVEPKEIELLIGPGDEVKVELTVPEELTAPVTAGSVVGKQTYYINGQKYEELAVTNTMDILDITYGYCLQIIWDLFRL